MLFSSVLTLATLPLCLAAPLEARSAASIISGISTVQNDTIKLNNTLNTFSASNPILSTITAFQIQQETTDIENALKSLVQTTKSNGNLSSPDSFNVALAVVNLLPVIQTTLNNIVVHKPAFAHAILGFGDISKTVQQSLITQKSLSDQFGAALTPKLASPYGDYAPQIIGEIDGFFKKAIAAYQKCTGLVCLPPLPSAPTLPKLPTPKA